MGCTSRDKSLPQTKCAEKNCSVNSKVCIECRLCKKECVLFYDHGDVKFQKNGKPFYHWRLIGTGGYLDEWADHSKRPVFKQ